MCACGYYSAADAYKMMVNSCSTKKAVVDQLKEQLIINEKDAVSRLQTIDSNCAKISVSFIIFFLVHNILE